VLALHTITPVAMACNLVQTCKVENNIMIDAQKFWHHWLLRRVSFGARSYCGPVVSRLICAVVWLAISRGLG
jgi:hypothetical protein